MHHLHAEGRWQREKKVCATAARRGDSHPRIPRVYKTRSRSIFHAVSACSCTKLVSRTSSTFPRETYAPVAEVREKISRRDSFSRVFPDAPDSRNDDGDDDESTGDVN